MSDLSATAAISPDRFRNVLGGYPTGVSVVTSAMDGNRYAMVVGSFTSISLDPPLVGFFPDKSSTSWPKIEKTGRFCVNVLGSARLDDCRHFASKLDNKFVDRDHEWSPAGLPVLPDTIAWVECEIAQVIEIGDHLLVVGAVTALDRLDDGEPLLFHGGGYHGLQRLAQA